MNTEKTYLSGQAETDPPPLEGYEIRSLEKQLQECKVAIALANDEDRVIRLSFALDGEDYQDYFIEDNKNVMKLLKAEQLTIKAQLAVKRKTQEWPDITGL